MTEHCGDLAVWMPLTNFSLLIDRKSHGKLTRLSTPALLGIGHATCAVVSMEIRVAG